MCNVGNFYQRKIAVTRVLKHTDLSSLIHENDRNCVHFNVGIINGVTWLCYKYVTNIFHNNNV